MLAKILALITITLLLPFAVASPLPTAVDHADKVAESSALSITVPPSSENIRRAPTNLVLNLIGCTMEVINWASYNPGRLTAKQDGILYGSIIPSGGLYLAVDPRDADIIGRASRCPGGTFVVVEYNFVSTGLRIVDMTAGQRYDETAHAVIGYFDPSRVGISAPHMKMYVLQNPIAVAEAHLKIKMINHKSIHIP
ncbi:hypothetical protein F5879DRAFT_931267 [Lentinula edodes]|uniref:Uncharacterized protein n=1 Tax=Lentinula edodes TaxID=5353 RepID=A0A1Q3E2T0_LENED|nr:hypothetical protein F5879DRAFT_931267 [Lentinula edodes]KAJ3923384.1 hypothetical protein F5877DRAFT_63340 [Lentinula edodes]GAW01540.1 hypothetical protein LENED_003142 [Lentinula edodes]